jgi:hypothetical protein
MTWRRQQAARVGLAEARRVLDAGVSERRFQETVIELAEWRGWRVFHPWSSIHSAAGYPDLTLVRQGRLVFAELKSEKGKVTPEQERWMAALSGVPAVDVFVWRPSDWAEIEEVLSA